MNSLISYLEKNKLGWSNDIVTTTGTPFVKCLTFFYDTSYVIMITSSRDLHGFQLHFINSDIITTTKPKAKAQLSCDKLMMYVNTFSGYIIQPWFNKRPLFNFRKDVGDLIDCTTKT